MCNIKSIDRLIMLINKASLNIHSVVKPANNAMLYEHIIFLSEEENKQINILIIEVIVLITAINNHKI